MAIIEGKLRLYATHDGIVHWSYPLAGLLLVCGNQLAARGGDRLWPDSPPTCLQCIAIVQGQRHAGEIW